MACPKTAFVGIRRGPAVEKALSQRPSVPYRHYTWQYTEPKAEAEKKSSEVADKPHGAERLSLPQLSVQVYLLVPSNPFYLPLPPCLPSSSLSSACQRVSSSIKSNPSACDGVGVRGVGIDTTLTRRGPSAEVMGMQGSFGGK